VVLLRIKSKVTQHASTASEIKGVIIHISMSSELKWS